MKEPENERNRRKNEEKQSFWDKGLFSPHSKTPKKILKLRGIFKRTLVVVFVVPCMLIYLFSILLVPFAFILANGDGFEALVEWPFNFYEWFSEKIPDEYSNRWMY